MVKRNPTKDWSSWVGKLFTWWEVISVEGQDKQGVRLLKCKCRCGTVRDVRSHQLRLGFSKSCGCYSVFRSGSINKTHGLSKTPEYKTWAGIIARCENKNEPHWNKYGGRGIKVHPAWRNSFETFLKDVGKRPAHAKNKGRSYWSLDRINNDGHYEPGNVRWATPAQQTQNSRHAKNLTYGGKTMCMSEWEKHLGLNEGTIKARIRYGWSVDDAINRPVRDCGRTK